MPTKTSSPEVCPRCHAQARLAVVSFRQITGIVMLVTGQTHAGPMCEACIRRIYRDVTSHNLLLGWWSGPSIIANPIVLVNNFSQRRRAIRELALPPSSTIPLDPQKNIDPTARQRLPWRHYLGEKSAPPNPGQTAVTAPVGLGVLACFMLFPSIIGVIALSTDDGNHTPQEAATLRLICWVGLIVGILLLTVSIYWSRRRANRTSDAPDLLAQVLPIAAIYELKRIHLTVIGFASTSIRLIALAQNRYDAPTSLKLDFAGAPTLAADLGPSEVAAFLIRLTPPPSQNPIQLQLRAASSGSGGKLVRFRPRTVLSTPERAAMMTTLAAVGSHISISTSGTPTALAFMNKLGTLSLAAIPNASPPTAILPQWDTVSLWSPENRMPPDFAASILIRWMEER